MTPGDLSQLSQISPGIHLLVTQMLMLSTNDFVDDFDSNY